MQIGTAEVIDEIEEPKRRRGGMSGNSGPGNSNSGRNPGGGDDSGDNGDQGSAQRSADAPREPFVPAKSRILTAFLLLVVLMTFGGLIGAYIVIATNKAGEWQPFELPIPVWISTILIFVSSIVYHLGKVAVDRTSASSPRPNSRARPARW